MNSAGVFAVSNVRSTLIGVDDWRGCFDGWCWGTPTLAVLWHVKMDGHPAKTTVFWRLGRGDKADSMGCNPSRMSFACEIVKATGYLFRARTLVKLVTRSAVDPPMRSWLDL